VSEGCWACQWVWFGGGECRRRIVLIGRQGDLIRGMLQHYRHTIITCRADTRRQNVKKHRKKGTFTRNARVGKEVGKRGETRDPKGNAFTTNWAVLVEKYLKSQVQLKKNRGR